jgi:hypothetical protein
MPAKPSKKRLKRNAPKGFVGSTPAEGPNPPAPEPTGARAGNSKEAGK